MAMFAYMTISVAVLAALTSLGIMIGIKTEA
jgi:hypothetical protein